MSITTTWIAVIACWVFAVVLAIADAGNIVIGKLTISHHTYTGAIFVVAVLFTVGGAWASMRATSLNDKAGK